MEDYKKTCPICCEKLISFKRPGLITRQCTASLAHAYYCEINAETKKVKYIRLPIDDKCSIYIGINFELCQTTIEDYTGPSKKVICLDKIIEPDFPFLESFKNKLNAYLRFQ